MDQTALIDLIQTYLDNELGVPIRTRGGLEDERPVPVVILDAFDVEDLTFHNTHLAQQVEESDPSVSDKRYFRFHYWSRFDYVVRHQSDRKASRLRDTLRFAFQPLVENPRSLDDDLNEVKLRGGGGFSLEQVEDTETAVNQSVKIRTFEQIEHSEEYETLEDIQQSFTVTN